jgi:hypothetical protein
VPKPQRPSNVGKTRTITDIDGKKRRFTILGEILHEQSTYPEKLICLQKLRFEDDGRIELRLAYYIIGKKPKMAGKWVWGQFATMIPVEDFEAVIHKATEKGWIAP